MNLIRQPHHSRSGASSAGRIAIADDHPLFRAALVSAIGRMLPDAVTAEAASLDELLSLIGAHPETDLVLLDLRMPGAQGFSSLIHLRGLYPAIPVAIVSAEEKPALMLRALDFGAAGFIPKSAGIETLGAAIGAILEGHTWLPPGVDAQAHEDSSDQADRALAARIASLTPQQFKVLMWLSDGRLNKQIAGDLGVTEATIKAHVTAILRKLGLYRRTQAALLAQRLLQGEGGPLSAALAGAGAADAETA